MLGGRYHDQVIDEIWLDVFGCWIVARTLNQLRDIQPLHNMSKKIIGFGKRRIIRCAYEELTTIRIRSRICHCHCTSRIVTFDWLIRELVARTAGTTLLWVLAQRITCLNDMEACPRLKHTVEDQPIIEVVLCQEHKVVHRLGS